MKNGKLLRCAGTLWLAFWLTFDASAQDSNSTDTVPLPPVCGVKLSGPRINWRVPNDVEGELKQKDLNVVQRATDIFSWQEFIALNWPAQPGMRGHPDKSKPIGAAGLRVWETWKETSEIYLAGGIAPPAWNAPEQLPGQCSSTRALSRTQKIQDEVDQIAQAAAATNIFPVTLTDQRGNVVRYEIRLNKVLFDYIVKRKLYNGDTQAKANSVSYPDGSMIIKASWREVSKDEVPRYLTVRACIFDKINGKSTNFQTKTMGLVGLHIMHKTPSAPQWIWSTFEHVDNLRAQAGVHPSFFDPYCTSCVPNQQTPEGVPNQVTRVIPISSKDPDCDNPTAAVDNIKALNTALQAALAKHNSVLQYYELINTQWPLQSGRENRRATVFSAQPALLANTTMETFIQESSSCMGCHSTARTVRTDRFVSSDFSFTLNNAKPRPTNPKIIPAPKQPVTDWDKRNWSKILRGKQIADHTYELFPKHVTAKLHCSSCHLDTGGNPTAAWWVGMTVKYAYPQTNALQNRINGCFERSMNGKAICDPDSGECASDPTMIALITYMQWLDAQYPATNPSGPMPNGFPALTGGRGGDIDRGRATFKQKCAFCHGPDGQGRYVGGVYFRPALWGPHSFNAQAGMGDRKLLAAFIKANMPRYSGGLLTDQEARDVAAFVDSHPRPGK